MINKPSEERRLRYPIGLDENVQALFQIAQQEHRQEGDVEFALRDAIIAQIPQHVDVA